MRDDSDYLGATVELDVSCPGQTCSFEHVAWDAILSD